MKKQNLIQKLRVFLRDDQVSNLEEVRMEHASDRWHASALADVVVFPESTKQVSQIVEFAVSENLPVYTRAAGTGHVGGCVPLHRGVLISMMRMNRILEINPADGLARVQPGVITGDLQEAVKKIGWYYPPDPASLAECTIGGNIATNAGGPRCLKYGVTKNYVLGLELILASGAILRTGGRCHKNVTGFDLCSLFVGSEGMLGIVTEITLRLIPHPEKRVMLGVSFADFSDAAQAVQAILDAGYLPSALEIADATTINAARDYLGKEKLPPGDAYLMLELDGNARHLNSQLIELNELLLKRNALHVDVASDETQCEKNWQIRRDFSYALKHSGKKKLNEDIVVPRSKLVDLVRFARELEGESGLAIACFGHAGDGNIHVNIMVQDYSDPLMKKHADEVLDSLFKWVIETGGAITGEHGVGLAKKPWFRKALGEVSYQTHMAVKKSLDPQNIFNPGKFLD